MLKSTIQETITDLENAKKLRKKAAKRSRQFLARVVLAVVILLLLAIAVSVWIGSKIEDPSSYWGSVIGGITSGVFAYTGVVFTISYYRQADRKKELFSYQPYMIASYENKGFNDSYGLTFDYEDDTWNPYDVSGHSRGHHETYIRFENKGNGLGVVQEIRHYAARSIND